MNVDIPFLASLLLKLHSGQAWTAEDVAALQSVALNAVPNAVPKTAPNTVPKPAPNVVPNTAAAAPTTTPKEPSLSIEKLLEPIYETPLTQAPTPVLALATAQATQAPAAATATKPLEISARHCLARMVQKKNVLQGTDANKVYDVKQCSRVRAKGELLCSKCDEYYTAYKEKSKGKANWEGFINEIPLDHLHVVGSKWFKEQYPAGIPDATIIPTLPEVPDPTKETLLENTPVKEVKWVLIKINGIQHIYNSYDRRAYRADVTKTGEDQILWDQYEGKYIDGTLDSYAEETEEPPA